MEIGNIVTNRPNPRVEGVLVGISKELWGFTHTVQVVNGSLFIKRGEMLKFKRDQLIIIDRINPR